MKSTRKNFELRTKSHLFSDHLIISRNGEERIGDYLQANHAKPQVLILGISESIGPFANYGRRGSEHAFIAFFKQFIQWPYQGQSFDVLGNITFIGTFPTEVEEASVLVEELDSFVLEVLRLHVSADQLPVVIGGGHNNALPLMRWANEVKACQTVINLDAHTDCRDVNRRHSGNSFSVALEEGVLKNYHVFGVHAYGITPFMKEFIRKHHVNLKFFESYYTGGQVLTADVLDVFFHAKGPVGVDLDMDCMANMPSSASSPSGWSLDEIRNIIRLLPNQPLAYLHLTEGAANNPEQERTIGRALAYLCLDSFSPME